MRVNITYSTELSQVPSEVARFIKQCENQLLELANMMGTVVADVEDSPGTSASAVYENIIGMRRELARVDFNLEDVMNIIVGYQKTMLQLQEQAVAQAAESVESNQDIQEATNGDSNS